MPTKATAPRLIDANALIEELRKHGSLASLPISIIDSLPTIPSTIPLSYNIDSVTVGDKVFIPVDSLIEAIKKLEASLK